MRKCWVICDNKRYAINRIVRVSLQSVSTIPLVLISLISFVLVLTLCKQTVMIPLTAYLLLSHITQHFLTFLISYAAILTYYFPPVAVGKFSNNHRSSPTDAILTFVTFWLKHNYPSPRLLTTLIYHWDPFAVNKIVPLAHT